MQWSTTRPEVLPCGPCAAGGVRGAKEIGPACGVDTHVSASFSSTTSTCGPSATARAGRWSIPASGPPRPRGANFSPMVKAPQVTRVSSPITHPDHRHGWLAHAQFGCRPWISRLEYLSCRAYADTPAARCPMTIRFLQRGRSGGHRDLSHPGFCSFADGLRAARTATGAQHGERFIGRQAWRGVGSGHRPSISLPVLPRAQAVPFRRPGAAGHLVQRGLVF